MSDALWKIDHDIEQIIEHGYAFDEDTGEITADFSDLDSLQMSFYDKMKACGLWVKNKRAMINAIREEEKALQKRRKALERAVSYMDDYILEFLPKVANNRLESPEIDISARKSKRVVVYDEDALPAQYIEKVVTNRIDKRAISADIKAGKYVPGAALMEFQNLHLK